MFVLVRRTGAEVEVSLGDPGDFQELSVHLRGVNRAAAGKVLLESGFGSLDGDHAWLDPAALRAAGEDSQSWRAGLAGMIEYAENRGWVDAGRVRAHIVRG